MHPEDGSAVMRLIGYFGALTAVLTIGTFLWVIAPPERVK